MENAPMTTAAPAASNTPLAAMQTAMSRQPIVKQIIFLIAIAASIALGGWVFMWSQSPSYQVLYNDLSAKDSSRVMDSLKQMGIDYKLSPNSGAILVPADKLESLRIKLAGEGFSQVGSEGMAMLDKNQGFGTSQFIEKARYQRAIAEELSRSISQITNVRNARVQLATPKQSVFVRDRKRPTASVVLELYAGRVLDRGQVQAIAQMVAASVPNMTNKDVTIVDQRGNLLTSSDEDSTITRSDNQLQYTKKLENLYIQRIENILAPIVGINGVRAQVVANVDFTAEEQTQESYDPKKTALRSEHVEKQHMSSAGVAEGIPGALSNEPPTPGTTETDKYKPVNNKPGQPGAAGAKDPSASDQENKTSDGSGSMTSTKNYEVDRTISHVKHSPGAVKRLSIAVLVDDNHKVGKDGKDTSTPLTPEQIARIKSLVQNAVGFDAKRGDSINVVNTAFMKPQNMAPLPSKPIWEEAWVWSLAKQIGGGLVVLFLILGVIRPAFRNMSRVPEGQVNGGGATGQPISYDSNSVEMSNNPQQAEQQIGNVRSFVQQNPALAAQVVKNWTAD